MSNILLTTKLQIPQLRTDRIQRSSLLLHLRQSQDKKLILVSAPAGYGKTTLVLEFLATYNHPIAWFSLEKGDNDPIRFWSYMINALQVVLSSIEKTLPRSLLQANLSLSETNLSYLINELDKINQPMILVLDDYHQINTQTIHEGLSFLIDHAPACFHMMIATRADPPLPLARLRSSSQLAEIRMADLRFSMKEIDEFMKKVMNLEISEIDLSLLDSTTEGWVAGLQMAGLSLQGKENISNFISTFSGENRYVLDFLFEEVFEGQPQEIRDFLLQTSILERLNASLCNAITQHKEGQSILTYLERNNLFIIPIDEQRQWYRYHILFRDLLLNRLNQSPSEERKTLHQRASAWYEAEGALDIAISHALAAKDFNLMANLLEEITPILDLQNQQAILISWLDQIPVEIMHAHPWLCAYRAWGSYWIGHRGDTVAEWIQAAEKAMELIIDESQKQSIQGYLATIRSHMALVIKNASQSLEFAQRALELLPERDAMRCEAAMALAGAYWALGDVIQTKKAFCLVREAAQIIDYKSMAAGSTAFISLQQIKQGLLNEAIMTVQDGLKLATLPDGSQMAMAGFLNIRLGDIWREKNQLEIAANYLTKGVTQCERLGQPDLLTDAYVCYARNRLAMGDYEATHEYLDKADHLARESKVDPWILCWLNDCRIKAWLAEENLEAANLWALYSNLTVHDPLDYQHDLHHQNLARVLVARHVLMNSSVDYEDSNLLLDRLLIATRKAGWVNEEIRILLLKATNLHVHGLSKDAIKNLLQAIILAQPGEYIRIFLDEGERMHELVRILHEMLHVKSQVVMEKIQANLKNISLSIYLDYVTRILSFFSAKNKEPSIDQLTAREMDVLHLLAKGFPDKKIAETLVITRETVHKHLKNIYEKLNVHSRTEAVIRSQELGLL